MADSLKVAAGTLFKAKHIRDLDIADPVRNIVLNQEDRWESILGDCYSGGANRIWVKRITFPVGEFRMTFDLLNGCYVYHGAGIWLPMEDGFGQRVTFEQVNILSIRGTDSNDGDDYLRLYPSAVDNWEALLNGFAATSYIAMWGQGHLLFYAGPKFAYDVSAAPGIGSQFDIRGTAGNELEITILGYHS